MGVDERARHDLYQQLARALGEEATATLMSYLPPVGWADVATRSDLDHLRVATSADLDRLGAELRGEMNHLGAELRGEMTAMHHELVATFRHDLGSQTRTLVFSLFGAIIGLGTLALGLSRLL